MKLAITHYYLLAVINNERIAIDRDGNIITDKYIASVYYDWSGREADNDARRAVEALFRQGYENVVVEVWIECELQDNPEELEDDEIEDVHLADYYCGIVDDRLFVHSEMVR